MQIRQAVAALVALVLLSGACGGGGDDEASADDAGIVVSQEQLDAALGEDDTDIARVETDEPDTTSGADDEQSTDATAADADEAEELEVTEVEDDPLDNMLNSLTLFNQCLADAGFELDGFPGDGSGRTAEEFDGEYLSALATCNSQTGIADAVQAFGAAQADRTPEEIAATNFGLPYFKECLEDLGWEVGELTPGADGALGFGPTGTELTPPGGGGLGNLNTDDINTCRREAEDYTDANYEAEA